ncbi:MAG TPA: hypothetical protein VHW60_15215 [Caulobacteraceae bacterium]|nr:hypothetical protein [Caulobacteraceae bacterium]
MADIENPAKSKTRAWRGRDRFLAEADQRAARAEEIKLGLPQIEFVIRIYDPDWDRSTAKIVKPHNQTDKNPHGTWTATALDILREADRPLTIAEIVQQSCEVLDETLASVSERQRRHTAINNTLRRRCV